MSKGPCTQDILHWWSGEVATEGRDEHCSSKCAASEASFINTYYFSIIWIYTEVIPILI